MAGLRKGKALLTKKPTHHHWSARSDGRSIYEPEGKVGLLPGRFAVWLPGEPQKMVSIGKERHNG
eukprot:15472797-Alexandrium_andersonii.AAC.1